MFISSQRENTKKENIYDILEGKILICKKEIACKEGVFKRNACIFPVIVNYKIESLFDLREWNCEAAPDTVCPKGTVLERINSSNYSDYFEINVKGSKLYGEIQEQSKSISYKETNFNALCRAFFEITLIMFTAAVIAAGFELGVLALLFLAYSALSLIIMMIIKMLKKRKILKLNASLDVIKEDLLSNIMEIEQFSGDDEYVKMKEKLVELANSSI